MATAQVTIILLAKLVVLDCLTFSMFTSNILSRWVISVVWIDDDVENSHSFDVGSSIITRHRIIIRIFIKLLVIVLEPEYPNKQISVYYGHPVVESTIPCN